MRIRRLETVEVYTNNLNKVRHLIDMTWDIKRSRCVRVRFD